MSGVKHTPWEVGQHPAMSSGWIVRPILFGSNVRVLPESEGGHVVIRDEKVARLIAAAPDLLEIAQEILDRGYVSESIPEERDDHLALKAAIARARGEQEGGGE